MGFPLPAIIGGMRDRVSFAASPVVAARMRSQRRRDTGCELAVRREAHHLGLRYFVHRRPLPGLRREADLVFPRAKVAVFVDGCLWHGHEHVRPPGGPNQAWWAEKLARTRARDADTDRCLSEAGWTVLRVWECDDPSAAAQRIATSVRRAE